MLSAGQVYQLSTHPSQTAYCASYLWEVPICGEGLHLTEHEAGGNIQQLLESLAYLTLCAFPPFLLFPLKGARSYGLGLVVLATLVALFRGLKATGLFSFTDEVPTFVFCFYLAVMYTTYA